MRVYVGATRDHCGDGNGSNDQAGEGESAGVCGAQAHEPSGQGETDGYKAEHSAGGVGELGCLTGLKATDERNAGQARGEPSANGNSVANGANDRQQAAWLEQGDHAPTDLEHCDGHEDAGEGGVLVVDADGPSVNDACAD